jgi:hypothetical protein
MLLQQRKSGFAVVVSAKLLRLALAAMTPSGVLPAVTVASAVLVGSQPKQRFNKTVLGHQP